MKSLKKSEFYIILILAATYNAIYSLAFMKGLYYTIMQSGLGLSHFSLGQLYSAWGLFSMFSYLCGAFFLNKFKCWKLVAFPSFIIGILTFCLAFLSGKYILMMILFSIMGFILGAAFYPAHLQILHQLGTPMQQGTVFSLFFVSNSIAGALFAILGFGISSIPVSNHKLVQYLFIFFAMLNIVTGILCVIFLRKLPNHSAGKSALSFNSICELMKNKRFWAVIIIVFTNYIAFSSLNYVLPFLSNTFSLSPLFTNVLTITRVYLIGIIAAPVAGKITDQLRSPSRVIKYAFILTSLTLFMTILFKESFMLTIMGLLLACLFINMGKSIALITIDEAGVPSVFYGMAISFISFSAYSPDAFYYSLSGKILDTFPVNGYYIVFAIVVVLSIVGFLASLFLEKGTKNS